MDADCHYGDHLWAGTSQCVRGCGARLRCGCGCYMREDNLEAHWLDKCKWFAKFTPVPVDAMV